MNTIYRIAEFGNLIVYRRGRWAWRERLSKYVVGRDMPGGEQCMLEEFRRKQSAIKWAKHQAEGLSP
jgi:hypothetical protein